jgi:RHH-type transcriptional regulator, rel operon repressor / antitoxin RelB
MMLAIRLPESIEKRLARLAERTGRTKTFYAREAIIRHIEDLEDVYEAERVLERVRAGKEATLTLDQMAKRLDLGD